MDKTPVYKSSFEYAYNHGEAEQCIVSNRANIACRDAIEKAISAHYRNSCLDTAAAVREVVFQFGFERMFYVLANTVQSMDWDSRVAHAKEWANSVPVAFEQGKRDTSYLITHTHPGLLNIFVQEARHEHLLSLPLKREDIKAEAAHILEKIQAAQEPNSPNGTHYMAQVSPDFMRRARTRDTDRLISMLPFQTLSLSKLEGRTGVYALIHRDEDRFQKLVLRRPSGRSWKKKQTHPPRPSPPAKINPKDRSGDMANRTRNILLKFFVTPQELEQIRIKMDQYGTSNLSAYLRKIAIDGYVVNLELPELREMVSLLRRSSNNLNQLTRRVHETGRFYDADLEDLRESYDGLWDTAQKILTSLAAIQ